MGTLAALFSPKSRATKPGSGDYAKYFHTAHARRRRAYSVLNKYSEEDSYRNESRAFKIKPTSAHETKQLPNTRSIKMQNIIVFTLNLG